jgi:tetratricopeptide (TPR) repeat protein
MASFKVDKKRNVVPNWREYNKTAKLGEFGDDKNSIIPTVNFFPIDEYVLAWRENHAIPFAGDLISAAILNGHSTSKDAIDAARFVLAHKDEASSSIIRAAESLVPPTHASDSNLVSSITDKLAIITGQESVSRTAIRILKHNRDFICFNPIAYCEMSRHYVNLGQLDKAKEMMDIAMYLAPSHRYICRSAARFYLHYGDEEKARYIIAHNPWINKDPWLIASEIAINTLMGRTSRLIKKGNELIHSKNYSPFSISELSSAIGSVEMINGRRKNCRELFRTALIKPNDNSLAQAKWLLSEYKDLSFEFADYSYLPEKYEADAMTAFMIGDHNKALDSAIDWIEDMPFTRRPVQFAADMAYTYVKDYPIAIAVLNHGLKANPNDAALLNNLAYAYALNGQTEEAQNALNEAWRIPSDSRSVEIGICLTATEGLNEYRKGNPALGRELYIKAIQRASYDLDDKQLARKAVLNFAREEIRSNPSFDQSLIAIIEEISDDSKETHQLKLDVKKEIEKRKE